MKGEKQVHEFEARHEGDDWMWQCTEGTGLTN